MGRVKMSWSKLENGAQKEISLGLLRCLQSERNLYYNSINSNNNRKDMKYKTQNNRSYNINNNSNNIDSYKNEYENFSKNEDNDNNNKYDNDNYNNENQLNEIEEGKEIAAKNRFIRHSKECLSILCKLGVTYEHLSVQLLQELIFASTDLMNIYVCSVNENERKSVNEINDKNRNKINEINNSNTNANTETNNNFDDNSVIVSGVKNIPPATLAAASLHWLSQMKIPYSALQLQHKNTVLRYLETVLHHSTKKGKSGISFPFLMSILTNLKISGIQYSDFDNGVKDQFQKFENFIKITRNKTKIDNSIQNDKNINLNTAENIFAGKIEEKNTQDLYIQKYENFMKSMNVPNEKNAEISYKINNSIQHGDVINGVKVVNEVNTKQAEKEEDMMIENVRNEDREVEKEKERDKDKMKNNENEKLLHRLSLRVAALPDSDLLRVVFLLGHRKISLKQLRLAHTHTSNIPVIRENTNTVLKSVNIPSENTNSDVIVYPPVTKIGSVSELGSESYEVRESLLDVLDSRLETVLKDLSPGKRTYIMRTFICTYIHICAYTYTYLNICTYTIESTHTHTSTYIRTNTRLHAYPNKYVYLHTHTCTLIYSFCLPSLIHSIGTYFLVHSFSHSFIYFIYLLFVHSIDFRDSRCHRVVGWLTRKIKNNGNRFTEIFPIFSKLHLFAIINF